MADRIVVMHDGRIQQVADPLTISTQAGERARRLVHGRQQHHPRNGGVPGRRSARRRRRARQGERSCAGLRAPGRLRSLAGGQGGGGPRSTTTARRSDGEVNSARPEIVFVEYLGDLVKLHLTLGGERLLAKVAGDRYPAAARDARARRSVSPGRRRMSSSSGPDGPETPRLDVAEIEQVEGIVEQAPRRARPSARRGARQGRAAGDAAGSRRPGPRPGALWLLFFLVAPGRHDHPRVLLDAEPDRLREGLHARELPDAVRVGRLLGSAEGQLLRRADRRRSLPDPRLSDRLLPDVPGDEPAQPGGALPRPPGAVPDQLPDPGGGVAVPAHGTERRREPGAARTSG